VTFPVITRTQHLNDIRDRRRELQRRHNQVRDLVAAAKTAIPMIDGTVDVSSSEFRTLDRATADLRQIETDMALISEEERYALSAMAGVDGPMVRDSFLQDPNVLDELRQRAQSTQPIGDLILGPVKGRDQMLADFEQRRARMAAAGDVVLPSDVSRTTFYGAIPPLLRQIRLLDLVPTSSMESGAFDILVESYAPGAAETPELALKPSGQVTLTDLTVKAVTMAVWAHISRQTLADVPALASSIDNLLRWDVEQKLESQMLNGTGTGGTLLGILNTTGIGVSASGTGDSVNADLVANAKRDVQLSNAEANAVVMNPTDATKALKVKASGSGERLDSDGAFGAVPSSMWGLPLIQTPAIAAGTALVGDFTRGCILYVREGITARMSDQDVDDFQRNAIKVLLEGRWGFATWRPTCFSRVTLSFAN
jgi:HK97 family phage major capsid protein